MMTKLMMTAVENQEQLVFRSPLRCTINIGVEMSLRHIMHTYIHIHLFICNCILFFLASGGDNHAHQFLL
jgi:hypothetical protein